MRVGKLSVHRGALRGGRRGLDGGGDDGGGCATERFFEVAKADVGNSVGRRCADVYYFKSELVVVLEYVEGKNIHGAFLFESRIVSPVYNMGNVGSDVVNNSCGNIIIVEA